MNVAYDALNTALLRLLLPDEVDDRSSAAAGLSAFTPSPPAAVVGLDAEPPPVASAAAGLMVA